MGQLKREDIAAEERCFDYLSPAAPSGTPTGRIKSLSRVHRFPARFLNRSFLFRLFLLRLFARGLLYRRDESSAFFPSARYWTTCDPRSYRSPLFLNRPVSRISNSYRRSAPTGWAASNRSANFILEDVGYYL